MKTSLFAVLADYANVTSDGKLNVMGIFDVIRAPSFPAVHPQMRLVLRLQGSPAERGSIKSVKIKMLDADGKQLLESAMSLSISAQDVDRLYKAWGFVVKKISTKHTSYEHPDYPDITAAVTRSSGDISKSYVTDAIDAIEELIARRQKP